MVTRLRYSDRVAGFTKLFGTIIHSTVWQEALHVKVVWITLLAMCGRRGVVEASIPGLAKAAGVSMAECQDALARLTSPDPFSRTEEHEGRRIEKIPGGWLILNYLKYRNRVDEDAQRIATAERVRKHRSKVTRPVTVTDGNAEKRQAEAEAEAEAEADPEYSPSKKKARTCVYSPEFLSFWAAYPKKKAKWDAFKAWKKESPPLDRCLISLEAQVLTESWTKDDGQFIPHPATWIRDHRWEDELPTKKPRGPNDFEILQAAAEKERAEERQAARAKQEEEW